MGKADAKILFWMWDGDMPAALRVAEHVMRTFHATQYPTRLFQFLDDCCAVHSVYYTHYAKKWQPWGVCEMQLRV